MTGIRPEFLTKYMKEYLEEAGLSAEEFTTEDYIDYLEERVSEYEIRK